MYGDPDHLRADAARLESAADDLRRTALGMRRRAAATGWESTAAEAHRDAVDRLARRVERAASALDEAARVLRAHADEVAHRLALIRWAERRARAWFARAESAFGHAVHSALRVLDAVTPDPPWSAWPWHPHRLPVPGHVDWLDVERWVRCA